MREIIIECDGNRLQAVLHTTCYVENRFVLVMCHGFRGSKEGGGQAAIMADKIASMGISVMRFDFTPLQNLTWQVREIDSIVDYCKKNISNNIILLGRSMGGSASLAYAAQSSNIKGLCLWATPWSLHETFRLALGENYKILENGGSLKMQDTYGILQLEADFILDFDNFNLIDYASRLNDVPVLILHGSKDEIVPLKQAEQIYNTLSGPKEKIIINDGNHQLADHSKEAMDAVISWISRYFVG
ncbi:alpha/beta hydrolase [Dendrosporobacter sp. 1207_IL3150]|uniref:alpha/beta hydrolase n=1 Tax=Dendrosporobacter sp. 1207_IL3150 TaxID=3084054 RepID=UPI002FD97660